MDTAEEIISKTADKSIEITQTETEKKKKEWKIKRNRKPHGYKTILMV